MLKRILNILDKKLGWLIFLLESQPLGTFLSFDFIVSLKSLLISCRLLGVSLSQKLSIAKTYSKIDNPVFEKEFFNNLYIDFFSDLRTGISFSARLSSNTSVMTLAKILDVYEDINYNDEENVCTTRDRIFVILSRYSDKQIIDRPFYRYFKEINGERVLYKIIPFRLSQLNSLRIFVSISILGLSISFSYKILIKILFIFLSGLFLGHFLF